MPACRRLIWDRWKAEECPVGASRLPPVLVSCWIADFNGDKIPDIVTCRSLLIGNGDGTFKAAQTINAGYGPIAVGDFNGDGKPVCRTTVPACSVMLVSLLASRRVGAYTTVGIAIPRLYRYQPCLK
jgi:hypothetical protein